jgi:hypothetical protein
MRRIAVLAGDASIAECPVLFWEGPFLALNVRASTARFPQLSEAFRKTYLLCGHFPVWPFASM